MGDATSDLIFSIDIGVVNVGIVLLHKKTRKIIFGDKVSLAPSLKSVKSEYEYVPRVYKLLFDPYTSKLRKYIDRASVVLIEKQMKTRMINIQHIISGFCTRFNIEYKFVSPRSIKAHFGIGAFSRKSNGTVVKGVKENHSANKKLAVAKATELYPGFMRELSSSKRDDVADALLQAVWFADLKENYSASSTTGESPFLLALRFDPTTYTPPPPPVKKCVVKKKSTKKKRASKKK